MSYVNVTIELEPDDDGFGSSRTVVHASAGTIDEAIESARARAVAAAGAWNTLVAKEDAEGRKEREQADRIRRLEDEVRELRETHDSSRSDAQSEGSRDARIWRCESPACREGSA